jgi:hypothetical protein
MPVEERKSVGKYACLGGASSGAYTYISKAFTSSHSQKKVTFHARVLHEDSSRKIIGFPLSLSFKI